MAAFGACILPHQQREIKSGFAAIRQSFAAIRQKRRILDMLVTKKMLLALTLVGALVGAGIGSLITHSAASSRAANTSYDNAQTTNPDANYSQAAYRTDKTPDQIAAENSSQFSTTQEQTAY